MKNRFFTREIYVCAHLTQTRYVQNMRRNEDYYGITGSIEWQKKYEKLRC